MTNVPAQYQTLVSNAARALGIPESVVAAQIDLESSWNPRALSPTGAEGIAQFEPSTFAAYGSGSPYNVNDAFNAYVAYMKALLKQEGGDVRKALEAYNAGPGNLGAGSGYASTILARAGSGDVTSGGVSSGDSGGSGSGGPSALEQLGSLIPGASLVSDVANSIYSTMAPVTKVFSDIGNALETTMHAVLWIVNPMNWVRILAGLVGGVSLITGAVLIAKAA